MIPALKDYFIIKQLTTVDKRNLKLNINSCQHPIHHDEFSQPVQYFYKESVGEWSVAYKNYSIDQA